VGPHDDGRTESFHFRFRATVGVELDRPCNGESAWWFAPEALAPLTDPKADAFIEGIKKLKPYEEPKVVKERV
jgi:hypothetical protein